MPAGVRRELCERMGGQASTKENERHGLDLGHRSWKEKKTKIKGEKDNRSAGLGM